MAMAMAMASGIRATGGGGVSVRVVGARVTMSLQWPRVSLLDRRLGWGGMGRELLLVNGGERWATGEVVVR